MTMTQELLVLISFFVLTNATPVRITVTCGRDGFNCDSYRDSERLVRYQCPPGVTHIVAYLWDLEEPSDAAFLNIRNCENVELNMICKNQRKYFKSLKIENVTNLRFTKAFEPVKNPGIVILKNIKNIEIIPGNTFNTSPLITYIGLAKDNELQVIEFENVHIGTIESHAFHSLKGFSNFTWRNVEVDRLQAHAIELHFDTEDEFNANFSVLNSTLQIAEHLSFQLNVNNAVFKGNKFVEIMSGGINGTIETFNFVDNTVNTLQAGSISILSKSVIVDTNHFDYLKAGCFEKIRPGLLAHSRTDFGNLKFSYKFQLNDIIYTDSGSLNPDMDAYDKVSTDLVFSHNNFLCTCENLGWLMSPIGHGRSTIALRNFYRKIKDEESSNTCSGLSCKKTISFITNNLRNGQCNSNLTLEYFCHETTTDSRTTSITIPKNSSAKEFSRIFGNNFTNSFENRGNIPHSISKFLIFVAFLSVSNFELFVL